MACERYENTLTDAALDALGPRERAVLDTHLANCTACRAELERRRLLLGAMDGGLRAGLDAEPSADFAARVRQRVASEGQRRSILWPAWAPAALGVVAVAALAVALLLPRQPSERANAPAGRAAQQGAVNSGGGANPGLVPPGPAMAPTTEAGAPSARRVRLTPLRRHDPFREVVVPPGQLAAVRQLQGALRAGRVEVASLLPEAVPLAERLQELVPPRAIVLPAVEVPALAGALVTASPEASGPSGQRPI